MDPNATYAEMKSFMKAGDFLSALEPALNLKGWLRRGGCAPSATTLERVLDEIRFVIAKARCEADRRAESTPV